MYLVLQLKSTRFTCESISGRPSSAATSSTRTRVCVSWPVITWTITTTTWTTTTWTTTTTTTTWTTTTCTRWTRPKPKRASASCWKLSIRPWYWLVKNSPVPSASRSSTTQPAGTPSSPENEKKETTRVVLQRVARDVCDDRRPFNVDHLIHDLVLFINELLYSLSGVAKHEKVKNLQGSSINQFLWKSSILNWYQLDFNIF